MESWVRAPGLPGAPGRGTGRSDLSALAGLLLLCARIPAQPSPQGGAEGGRRAGEEITLQDIVDHPPVAKHDPGLSLDILSSDPSGDVTWPFFGNVRWDFESGANRLELLCDRLLLVAPRALGEGDASRGIDGAEADEGGEGGAEAESEPDESAGPARSRRTIRFYVYADGNVRLRLARQSSLIEADSLYYERHGDGGDICFLRKARLQTTVAGMRSVASSVELRDVAHSRPLGEGRGLDRLPIVVSAEVLWTRDFEYFHSETFRATTCDYELPHFSIGAPLAEVRTVGPEDGARDFTIDLSEGFFEFQGKALTPFPVSHWDTRWHNYFPIRDVSVGQSSKYGFFAGVDWNLNFFLKRLPLERMQGVERFVRTSRLDFETTYFSDRGFGWGPKGEYGTLPLNWLPWQLQVDKWDYFGEGRYFSIRDSGVDRSSPVEFPDPDRHWTSVLHRQAVPYVGYVDVEYSRQSDANFLREYFERVEKEEKRQESLVVWRRNLRDNTALTGLFKYRSNDFDTDVESLPSGAFRLLQEPVFRSGLYTDIFAEAGSFRLRQSDALMQASRRTARFAAVNEWAYPLGWFAPYVEARPFFAVRYTNYDEVLDPADGSEDRFSLEAGITVSQEWRRTFDSSDTLLDTWFGIDRVRHVVVPEVAYLNRFVNDLASSETLGLDPIDAIDLEESVALSLRQAFVTRQRVPGEARKVRPVLGRNDLLLDRREYATRSVLDSDISLVLFPRSGRDNDGDLSSLMVFDNTFYPGRNMWLRAWFAADVNDGFRFDSSDLSASVELVPDVLTATVGDRFTRREGNPEGDTNFVYLLASLRIGEKWRFQGFWSHDIEQGRDSEISFTVARVLHRFALFFEFSLDPGEDYNQTFSVNFSPLSMLGGLRERWTP